MAAYTEEELTQVLATIPEDLRHQFIAEIKRVNREYAKDMTLLAPELEEIGKLLEESGLAVEDEEDKRLSKEYAQGNAEQQIAIYALQQAKSDRRRAEFEKQHPEVATSMARLMEVGAKYGSGEADLKVNFCSLGGTEEQFDALRQAVLDRRYSAKRPEPATVASDFKKSEPT